MIEQVLLNYFVEKKVEELFQQGFLRGTIHLSFGQEAVDVGVIQSFADSLVFGNHRSHGQYLVATSDVRGLFEQLKQGMSQHLYYPDKFMSHGIQGGLTPVAVGTALAFQKHKIHRKVICFIGDGTFGEGILYEAFRMAALWQLNILFVVMKNFYAMSKTQEVDHREYWYIAKAFNFDVRTIYPKESKNVREVANSVQKLDYTKPQLLLANVHRLCGHSVNDTQTYRPALEISKQFIEEHSPIYELLRDMPANEFVAMRDKIIHRIEGVVSDVF